MPLSYKAKQIPARYISIYIPSQTALVTQALTTIFYLDLYKLVKVHTDERYSNYKLTIAEKTENEWRTLKRTARLYSKVSCNILG